MPQYAVLIFERETPGGVADIPPDVMEAHMKLPERIAEQGGREVAGLALEQTTTATSIRGDVITDGPFIETKEALGGFYIIDAKDLDQALALAKLCPSNNVEVRPVMDTSEGSGPPA